MKPVVIVGAGVAGLICAIELTRAGRSVLVIEAEPQVGGRVRSADRDGCVIDRGFQVLFTAYPVITSYLDMAALDLRRFRPAAHVVTDTQASLIGDALSDPTLLLNTVAAGIPLTDKLRLLALRNFAKQLTVEQCFAPEYTCLSTRALLVTRGFDAKTIDGFFAPFYGGIMLDRSLSTNAGVLLFTFKMLAEGDTAVPARGMRAISDQLAARLPLGSVLLNNRVAAIRIDAGRATGITLSDGSVFDASDVVLATDSPTTCALAATAGISTTEGAAGVGSTSLYFTAARAPLPGKSIWLNASVDATISHAVTLTEVVPEYGAGKHLLVATAVGAAANLSDERLIDSAARELSHMVTVGRAGSLPDITCVDVQRVPYSQFAQPPGFSPTGTRVSPGVSGLWRASELLHSSSLDGAARGGHGAAMALLAESKGSN